MAYRKKKYYKKKKNTLTNKVDKLVKQVKLTKPELKYSESSVLTQRFNNDPLASYIAVPLEVISQGLLDINNRVGDQISIRSHTLRVIINHNVASAVSFRIVCLQFKQNIESLVTTASIGNMIFDSNYTGTDFMPICPYDYDNKKAFKVLYDKHFTCNPNDPTTNQWQRVITCKIKKPSHNVTYFHGATTITKGGLYWFFLTDQNGLSAASYASCIYRTYYYDA